MSTDAAVFRPLYREGDVLRLLDQRLLPAREAWLTLSKAPEIALAIRDMAVRGAPAIGVAASYGAAFSMRSGETTPPAERFETARHLLAATRPTAVNLFASLERRRALPGVRHSPRCDAGLSSPRPTRSPAEHEACRRIGRHGRSCSSGDSLVMTHCNAGALATAGYGTASASSAAPSKRAKPSGSRLRAPFLQGARLTAWEPGDHIPIEIITTAWEAASLPRRVGRRRRRRPYRRQRRHRQQDRDLFALRPGEGERRSLLRRRAGDHDRPRLSRRLRDSDRRAQLRRSPFLRRPFHRPGGRRRAVRRLRRHARPLHHRHRDGSGNLPAPLHRESRNGRRVRLEEQFVIGDW